MKKAFTMLELVFVIVIVGILSYFVSSSFQRNPLREAADQVVSHIRYTQHLAMIDDKFDPNDARFKANPNYSASHNGEWYKEFWRMRFYTVSGIVYYVVFTDKDRNGNVDTTTHTEPAIDPLSSKYLFVGNTPSDPKNNNKMDLTTTFGITSVTATCDTGYLDFFFDNLGRPYVNSVAANPAPYSGLLRNDCNITLANATQNVTITIVPETGYTYISAQNY